MNPIRTLVVVALAIVGLATLDRFLAETEKEEVRAAAERAWRYGTQLLHEGHAEAALDSLRNAHALARGNATYELDMIAAMTALGRTSEADPLIDEVLSRKPNDGPSNLVAARLKVKEHDLKDAEAFYHRAIYGEWTGDAEGQSRDARLELVQLLARGNSRQELLAELIGLEAAAGQDDALRLRIAHLFLTADAASRAATLYRAVIEKNPDEADAYEGLGEAELRMGQYRAARAAFVQAAYKDQKIAVGPRLVLMNEVIQLDPTPRRLPTAEKYGRAVRILALAKGDLEGLLAQRPGAGTAETARLLKAASDLSASKSAAATNEMAEQNLDLAEQIWKVRIAVFGPSMGPGEEVLRLIMERLAS